MLANRASAVDLNGHCIVALNTQNTNHLTLVFQVMVYGLMCLRSFKNFNKLISTLLIAFRQGTLLVSLETRLLNLDRISGDVL